MEEKFEKNHLRVGDTTVVPRLGVRLVLAVTVASRRTTGHFDGVFGGVVGVVFGVLSKEERG